MPYLIRFGPHILGALLVLLVCRWFYVTGGNTARIECMEAAAKVEQQRQLEIDAANRKAAQANEALRRELAKPAPGQTIREVVRNAPSDCRVDPAVADSVRQAVREANARAAAK